MVDCGASIYQILLGVVLGWDKIVVKFIPRFGRQWIGEVVVTGLVFVPFAADRVVVLS